MKNIECSIRDIFYNGRAVWLFEEIDKINVINVVRHDLNFSKYEQRMVDLWKEFRKNKFR